MSLERTPSVFISSTCFDLRQVREDLREFFIDNYGFDVMLSEFDSFPIDPCRGTFENCLKNVDEYADLFILIVGTRYGFITDQGKSITNLEFDHAKAKGIPIYVFIDSRLNNNLALWKNNRDGDYSSIVDNPKLFEFISEIYDESNQWIYTFNSVRDIESTLKNQLLLTFVDGLKYKKIVAKPQNKILYGNIPSDAARMLIEQPYAWEYKFLAYVLKNEFLKLQERKWDFRYGIINNYTFTRSPKELVDTIEEKLNEIMKYVRCLDILINKVLQDALGDPGVPSDIELIVYVSKQIASIYEKIVSWALFFKAIHAEDHFSQLLELLYELPKSALNSIDEFIDRIYEEMTNLPDKDLGIQKTISITCKLESPNISEITAEMDRLSYYFSSLQEQ